MRAQCYSPREERRGQEEEEQEDEEGEEERVRKREGGTGMGTGSGQARGRAVGKGQAGRNTNRDKRLNYYADVMRELCGIWRGRFRQGMGQRMEIK